MEESFMEPLRDYIPEFKIRGSIGTVGNQNIDPYQFVPSMESEKSKWLDNNTQPITLKQPGLVSGNFTWETVRTLNLGFDISALKNRLSANFDLFRRDTKDMLTSGSQLPATLGATAPLQNVADLKSTGFELELAWRDQIGKVHYNIGFNLYDYKAYITKFKNNVAGVIRTSDNKTYVEGQQLGEIWGYVTHGIAKTDEEMQDWLANHKQSFGNSWAAGDIMYEDLNGDGEVNEGSNTITDSGDKKIIGNSSPRYKFGIDLDASWNGFDIRMFFQGVAKRDYWLGDNMFWGASGGLWQSTCFTDHLDFFRSEGDDWGANLNAYFPRPILDGGKNQKKQTRYLQNAAYLRLKNLQIGYTLPASLTNKAGLSKLRVFLSVENLFTISGLPDSFDPETLGSGYGNWNGAVTESAKSYPLSRTVSTGLSVTF